MHINDLYDLDLDYYVNLSLQEEENILQEHLAKDLPFYNFDLQKWEIDLSEYLSEGGIFEYSNIGIVHKYTKEGFAGWSDYIASSDGKELYIFWDSIRYDITGKRAKKYNIKEKRIFGIPSHIQKQFSDTLKQEIIDEKHCGATQFFRSHYLDDVIKALLRKKSQYYESAMDFLKSHSDDNISLQFLEQIDVSVREMSLNEKLAMVESLNKMRGFQYFRSKDRKHFIKYDKAGGDFLIINDQKKILEYWKFPQNEFGQYIIEHHYEKADEGYFNLHFKV